METVLLILFEEDENSILEDLLHFLESKGNVTLLKNDSSRTLLRYKNLVLDPQYRSVKVNGQDIELTNYEFETLYLLAKNPGQVFSKEQIYNQVWKTPYYGAEDNVMSLIRRIRKKIEPNPSKPIYILTVWGIGYKFNNVLNEK